MGARSIQKREKMSFESLVKKLMKEGKSKTAATKIAGSVANAKMKGAGSGPTAKQKARAKSPATKKPKPRAVIRDKDRVADKSRSYTDKKGRKIEIKTFNAKKRYDSGVKDDPNEPSMKRKSSRLSNTVELHKTKTKKDGTTKTKVKRAAGGGKKSQRLHTKFAKGKNKEGASDVTITRKSPTTMKQGKNKKSIHNSPPTTMKQDKTERIRARKNKVNEKLDKTSAYKKDKKNTVTGKKINPKFERLMDKETNLTDKLKEAKSKANTEKSPATKPLKGKQKSLPKELQEAILKSPGKMLSKSGIKMMDKSPATMKKPKRKSKQRVEQDYARNAIADYKSGKTKEAKYEKKKALEVAAGESPAKMKKTQKKKKTYSSSKIDPNYHDQASKTVSTQKGRYSEGKTKTKFVNSDSPYHDKNYMNRESLTKTKTVNKGYGQSGRSTTNETQKSISPKRADRMRSRFRKGLEKQSPSMMKTNQDGGGYAAKNPAAPARQLKKLGSVLSKHFKSNM